MILPTTPTVPSVFLYCVVLLAGASWFMYSLHDACMEHVLVVSGRYPVQLSVGGIVNIVPTMNTNQGTLGNSCSGIHDRVSLCGEITLIFSLPVVELPWQQIS